MKMNMKMKTCQQEASQKSAALTDLSDIIRLPYLINIDELLQLWMIEVQCANTGKVRSSE